METSLPENYKILQKTILNVKLYGLNTPYWYDSFGNVVNWTESVYSYVNDGTIVYNLSGGTVPSGFYMWTGTTVSTNSYGDEGCDFSLKLYSWVQIPKSKAYNSYMIPLFLESTIDDMGVMVGFNGEMEQVEQICNFSYTQTGNTVQIYNTVDTSKVSEINDVVFNVDWGDGNTTTMSTTITTVSNTYVTNDNFKIKISLDTPWTKFETNKIVTAPSNTTVYNPMGTLTGFTIPYTNISGQTQDYLYDYDYNLYTGNTTFSYASIGVSRISEKKLYGSNNYSGVTTGSTNGSIFSGYTIDGLKYMDFEDGITIITGSTSGYTKEEIINNVITRNEHFLGFIDEPSIYSDIFVERGKQGVLEKTLRLSEIENIGELTIYGNGYFNIRKQ